jgi:hypothetical protein
MGTLHVVPAPVNVICRKLHVNVVAIPDGVGAAVGAGGAVGAGALDAVWVALGAGGVVGAGALDAVGAALGAGLADGTAGGDEDSSNVPVAHATMNITSGAEKRSMLTCNVVVLMPCVTAARTMPCECNNSHESV